jgi:hypothetical protein
MAAPVMIAAAATDNVIDRNQVLDRNKVMRSPP